MLYLDLLRRYCFIALCVMPGCIVSNTTIAADQWFEDYAAQVKRDAQKYNVPGYAMVFYQQGKSPVITVYGRTHSGGKPVDENTVFRLASVSKTFTAVLMAKLVRGVHFALCQVRGVLLLPGVSFCRLRFFPLPSQQQEGDECQSPSVAAGTRTRDQR